MIPKKIVYEQERNRVEPVCATCLKACKFIYEVPNIAEGFYCQGYYPQPEYHDKLWNKERLLSNVSCPSEFGEEFLKHAEKFHPVEF